MSPAVAGGFFTTDLPPGKPNDSTLDCVKCYCQQTEGDRLLTKDSAQMDNQVIWWDFWGFYKDQIKLK